MGELNSLPTACPKPEANESMTLPIFKNQRAVGDIHELLILFITKQKYSVRVKQNTDGNAFRKKQINIFDFNIIVCDFSISKT